MDVITPTLNRRRCTATNSAGDQCGRAPIPGGTVCVSHGGGAKPVRFAAQARLMAAADYAIDYLVNLLTPRPPCPACGRSDADRDPVVVRACQLVLDRAGFGPHATIEVEQQPNSVTHVRRVIIDAVAETTTQDGVDVEDAATPIEEKHGTLGISTPDTGVAEEES